MEGGDGREVVYFCCLFVCLLFGVVLTVAGGTLMRVCDGRVGVVFVPGVMAHSSSPKITEIDPRVYLKF